MFYFPRNIYLESFYCSEDMTGSNDSKLEEVDKMEGEVSKEILLYNILTSDFNEHCKGFGHLAVSNKRELLDMVVPHLHELLLPGIDVGEVVYHLAGLDP